MAARSPTPARMVSKAHAVLCMVVACLFAGTLLVRADPPLPPKPDRYFNDYAKVVPADAAAALNAKLEQFERQTSNQILVAVFPKLPEGTYLEDYTIKTFESWGPGGKRQDNGLVVFAFIEDRKVRMEVGYGLEGVVPDTVAASIIRDVMAPQLKLNHYAAAFDQGVDAIFKATRNEYKGTGSTIRETAKPHTSGSGAVTWLVIILFIVFVIWCHMGDTMIQRGGRFLFWNLLNIATSGSGSSGGGSSGSSSGGFSGGGGSGGGGGASGSW